MVIKAPPRRGHWSRGFEDMPECVGIWGKSIGGRGNAKCKGVRGVLLGVSEGQERVEKSGSEGGAAVRGLRELEYSKTAESFWRLLSGDLTCSK